MMSSFNKMIKKLLYIIYYIYIIQYLQSIFYSLKFIRVFVIDVLYIISLNSSLKQ